MLGAGWWKALLYSAGNWLLDLTALLIALAAVGAEPRASVVLLAYVVAAFLGMIPITPGGLGFVEAGLVGTLAWPASAPTRRCWRRSSTAWPPTGCRYPPAPSPTSSPAAGTAGRKHADDARSTITG